MKRVFAPGCALVLYKLGVARRLREYLDARHGPIGEHLTCCRHEPGPVDILIPPYQAFSTWSSQISSSGFSRR